jgi:hypothetical protein
MKRRLSIVDMDKPTNQQIHQASLLVEEEESLTLENIDSHNTQTSLLHRKDNNLLQRRDVPPLDSTKRNESTLASRDLENDRRL